MRWLPLLSLALLAGCGDAAPQTTRVDRARILVERGRLDEAAGELTAAIAESPGTASLLVERGIVNERAGDLDAALADYTAAIEASDASPAARNNRAAIYGRRGQYEDALADLDASLAIDPDQPLARRNRGTALLDLGRDDEAAVELEAARVLAPTDPETLTLLGLAHLRADNLPAAEASLREAISRDEEAATAYRHLGVVLLRSDRPADAITAFTTARDLDARLDVASPLTEARDRVALARFVATNDRFDRFTLETGPARIAVLESSAGSLPVILLRADDGYRVEAARLAVLRERGGSVLLIRDDAADLLDAATLADRLRPVLYEVQAP